MLLPDKFKDAVCNICGERDNFVITDLNQELDEITQLRENIVCQKCGSSSRDRMLIFGFQQALGISTSLSKMKPRRKFRVLETSGSRGHPEYLKNLYDYYNIWYEPEVMRNGDYDTSRYGDLQDLSFRDGYFDVILSSDVFEHIRLYRQAFLEVFRVLKHKGSLVLQVPFLVLENRDLELVEVQGDKDVFLAPPQYHASNTLVYRRYGGLDLIPLLWQVGFYVRFIEAEIPGYAISWQNVILCYKKPAE